MIELKDGNLQPVNLDSGNIAVDIKKRTVHISIKVSTNGVPQDFVGNGTYRPRGNF